MNVYDIVTDRIVELLRQDTVPWRKPWNTELGMPRSLSTRKAYRGINVWLLGAQRYESPWWGTYAQVKQHGGQIRKGEKASLATFWTKYEVKNVDSEESTSERFILRFYRVFNACQSDGIETPQLNEELREHVGIPACDDIKDSYFGSAGAPSLSFGGSRAYYRPSADHVQLPVAGSFPSREGYYSTLFHEMTHSTGHVSRLGRKDLLESHNFGDASYSREELVAEMGAAMLCGVAGIDQTTLPNSASYIASWIKVLKGDSKLVVQAAAQAQKASDLIIGAASAVSMEVAA